MEQNENDRSPDDPPATGSGLFYRDGREIPPTHPDHGPMHLLPRQEDGSFAAYYYCSKAELYDMQVPAPPPRRYRKDGFSPERQEQFLEYVRGGASGREAARRVGISPTTAYNLYNSPDGAAFRSGWDEAARVTDIVLEDTAFDRAVNGQEEIVYHQGQRVGTRWKYDNNLLMKLLRARLPLKYAPLSEIEGWLRHRGIAPPADVDGALDRLREAEAEWGSRLPGEEPSNRLANEGAAACPELPTSVRAEPVEVRSSCAEESKDEPPTGSARTDAGFEDPSCPSMSSTSPGTGPAEDPAAPTSRPELVEGPSCRSGREDEPGPSTATGRTEWNCEDASDPSTSSTSSAIGQADDPAAPSTSSTSPGTGPAEDPAAASTSSTSPGTGQEDSGSSMSSSSSGPGRQAVESGGRAKPPDPDDGSIPYYRPPPGPRSLSASSRTRTATTASARR